MFCLVQQFRKWFFPEEEGEKPGIIIKLLKGLLFLVVTVMLGLSAFYMAGYPLLYYNNTESTTKGFYFIDIKPGYQYGDFVIVEYKEGYGALPAGSLLLKQIKGLPGDTYIRRDGELEVQGRRYPVVENPKLPQIAKGTHVVPEGKMLVLNDRVGSFDGRYIGPMDIGNIRRKVFLVFNSEAFHGHERALYEYLKVFL